MNQETMATKYTLKLFQNQAKNFFLFFENFYDVTPCKIFEKWVGFEFFRLWLVMIVLDELRSERYNI